MTTPSTQGDRSVEAGGDGGSTRATSPDIRHDRVAQRFITVVDGYEGIVDYQLRDGVMIVTHTRVPASIGGRGIAARLNAAAIDHARQHGLKVSAQCAYTATWLQRHPELTDLLA